MDAGPVRALRSDDADRFDGARHRTARPSTVLRPLVAGLVLREVTPGARRSGPTGHDQRCLVRQHHQLDPVP